MKTEKELRERFQANMLDGDDLDYCGGAMISAKEVFEYFMEERQAELDELVGKLEGGKKRHREFECNGTRKYEDWCEDENCPSVDAKMIKSYNEALDKAIELIKGIE